MKVRKIKLKPDAKKKIIISAIIVICIVISSIGIYFGVTVYNQIKDFDIDNLTSTTRSSQIGEDGKSYYTYGSAQGKYTYYSDLPEVFVDAIVSAEDSRFFIHDGFDAPRIFKALLSNIVARSVVGGGSTITQQLIKKTYYPNEEQTLQRKLGEVILSIQASQQTTKQKVIELYVNKIYFGRSEASVGVYAASKYYFDKTPNQLTLPEAALLAGTLNAPGAYDPFNNLTKAQNRRNIVLNLMYQHGYITKEQRDATKNVPVSHTLKANPLKQSSKYASYVDRVTREVKQLTGYDPSKTNMTIYTYLDTEIQQYLDDIASGENFKFPDKYMQTGGVVQEATTGRVVGILSARDFKVGNYSYAFTDKHQPGSSIKPILDYGSAFEYLYWSTGHTADDSKYTSGNWTPRNWDRQYHGDVTLYEALGKSWNLAAIHALNDVIKKVGKDKVVQYLSNIGFDMDKESFSLAYAIGGWSTGVTPMQMAASYAAISNGGNYIRPHTIKKVVINTTGETIEIDKQLQSASKRVMSKATTFMLREIMTSYVKQYSDYSSFDIGMKIGAKSGTTNHDGKIAGIASGRSKDNWLCAYSEDYSWAFWNGYTDSDQKEHKLYLRGTNQSKLIAAKVASLLKKRKTKNSYATADNSNVVRAKMVKGVYPYVSPGSARGSTITAYFEKDHTPSGSSSSSSDALLNLSSFSASLTSDNKIKVIFEAYDPDDSNADNVVYKVDVYQGDDKVYSRTLNSATGTLNYTLEDNTTYRVIGYYALSNSSTTSNKVTSTLSTSTSQEASYTVTANNERITSGSQITSSSIRVTPTGSSSSTFTVSLTGSSTATTTVSANQSARITNLVEGGSYTLTVTERTSSGSSRTLNRFTFTVSSGETNDND